MKASTLLKLLQLHLERHPPAAPIVAFALRVEPAEPRRVQGGIFLPPAPPADKLQITLVSYCGNGREENVGTPRLLNTHRPDAFQITALNVAPIEKCRNEGANKQPDQFCGSRCVCSGRRSRTRKACGVGTKRSDRAGRKRKCDPVGRPMENIRRMVGFDIMGARRMGRGFRRWRALPHLS